MQLRGKRGVIFARQSDTEPGSTSIDAQIDDGHALAAKLGIEVVGVAADPNTSATEISILDRPQAGKWTTPEGMAAYDVAICRKLDRMSRRDDDAGWLTHHFKRQGKLFVTTQGERVYDPTDPSTRVLLAIENVQSVNYADATAANIRQGRRKGRELGRWRGGPPPMGFKTAPVTVWADRGRVLVRDDEMADYRLEAMAYAIGDHPDQTGGPWSFGAITRWLNRKKIPTNADRSLILQGKEPKGTLWDAKTTREMLASRSVLGQLMHDGAVIRGEDGLPIQFAEPLTSMERFAKLQEAVAKRKTAYGDKTQVATNVSGLVKCPECGGPVNSTGAAGPGKPRRYKCHNSTGKRGVRYCWSGQVQEAWLMERFESTFLDYFGDDHMPEIVQPTTVDPSAEIADLERQLDDLLERSAGKPEIVKARYDKQITAVEARLTVLAEQATTYRPGPRRVLSTVTYREWWEAHPSWDERRAKIKEVGITAWLITSDTGLMHWLADSDPNVLATYQPGTYTMPILAMNITGEPAEPVWEIRDGLPHVIATGKPVEWASDLDGIPDDDDRTPEEIAASIAESIRQRTALPA
ncbi:hypothetical protein Afil01_07750 [Actinorhabdospora filicis]|uniref:Recombinase family protein n=2 Tax=Actinorhabdospora filicis TaxID=1785913 RepID=A0A9W6W7I1_9ACTN|nr:hypothetical protein Afil01_07750 [Actinorhabdospora filicis]